MENYEGIIYETQDGELTHWGIKGQKWGVRRFQNPDGSLTPEGQKRYAGKVAKLEAKQTKLKNKQEAIARKNKIKSLKDDIANRKKAIKSGDDTVDKDAPEHVKNKKRDKLLKSNDTAELYKNRHLLTTSELKERIDRINTEQSLKGLADKNAPKKKTAIDVVDGVVKWGNKANELYKLTETSLGKKVLKTMGFNVKDQSKKDKWAKDIVEDIVSKPITGKDVKDLKEEAELVSKLLKIEDKDD